MIGEGSKETPEPEETEEVEANPLGVNDRSAFTPHKHSIDVEANTKPRRVSKTGGTRVP